jgi:predicted Zn-dependent protease
VQPNRIDIVKVPRRMTLAEFAEQYASAVPLEELARINQLDSGATLEAGTLIKRVTA